LAKKDSANAAYFKSNLDAFLLTVEDTDAKIKQILSTIGNESKE
jgi:ABC-type Zn uptake system ZnuABC Zn-binding protein ZnuA